MHFSNVICTKTSPCTPRYFIWKWITPILSFIRFEIKGSVFSPCGPVFPTRQFFEFFLRARVRVRFLDDVLWQAKFFNNIEITNQNCDTRGHYFIFFKWTRNNMNKTITKHINMISNKEASRTKNRENRLASFLQQMQILFMKLKTSKASNHSKQFLKKYQCFSKNESWRLANLLKINSPRFKIENFQIFLRLFFATFKDCRNICLKEHL